jgi:hypothetical protein
MQNSLFVIKKAQNTEGPLTKQLEVKIVLELWYSIF